MKALRNIKMVGIVSLALAGSLYAEGGILDMVEKERQEGKQEQLLQEEYKTKSGFFLGLEMGAGSAGATQDFTFTNTVMNADVYDLTLSSNASKTLFDMGLKLGYQHYFGETQNHGIRASLGIGSAVPPLNTKNSKEMVAQVAGDQPNSFIPRTYLFEMEHKIIPLKVSLEVDYLWDFFNRGDHTVGLDVGLGYEMGVWFGKSNFSRTSQDEVDGKIRKFYENNSALLTHTIYPKIGIHYYYGNHQFNLTYKFGGIFDGIKAEKSEKMSGTIEYGGQLIPTPNEDKAPFTQSIQSSPSYISFGYSYRF